MKKSTIRPIFIDSLQEKKRKIFAQPKKIKLAFKKQMQRVQIKCEREEVFAPTVPA